MSTDNPLVPGNADAVIYLMEMILGPAPGEWKFKTTSTKTSCEIDGAEPGKRAWFRISAVNAAGQGPWCEPALREVM